MKKRVREKTFTKKRPRMGSMKLHHKNKNGCRGKKGAPQKSSYGAVGSRKFLFGFFHALLDSEMLAIISHGTHFIFSLDSIPALGGKV